MKDKHIAEKNIKQKDEVAEKSEHGIDLFKWNGSFEKKQTYVIPDNTTNKDRDYRRKGNKLFPPRH